MYDRLIFLWRASCLQSFYRFSRHNPPKVINACSTHLKPLGPSGKPDPHALVRTASTPQTNVGTCLIKIAQISPNRAAL